MPDHRHEGDPSPSWGPHNLRDYALIADGERGALVGPDGGISWMCFPRWDSDAVFADLIGGGGGYSVSPVGRFVWGGHYEEGTLVWRSRWVTTEGIVESREALVFPGGRDRALLLRRVVGVAGRVELAVVLRPRSGFGAAPFRGLRRDDAGVWSGRTGDVHVRWSGGGDATDRPDGHGGRELVTRLEAAEGSQRDFVLELAAGPADGPLPEAAQLWSSTATAWERAVPSFEGVVAQRDVRRSYAVLRGMTGEGRGTVAAATMSLPERAGAGRSYDYRYVWIRDQCYIGQAMAAAGGDPLLDDAVAFVSARLLEDGPRLAPAYRPDGGRLPDERSLDLPGYPGGTDIVGNHVNAQFQLDALGESLLLLASAARLDRLDGRGWKAAQAAVDAVAQRWREPDAGVWELTPRRWTHSRLVCVAGLRALANAGAPDTAVGPWMALAEAILADTTTTCLHPTGRWQRAVDDDRVDAALLLGAIRGALPVDDVRSRATLRAVRDQLTLDGYAYRFRPDSRPLGEAEGSFLLCGFLLAIALHLDGDRVEAARWFERNRAASGPAGLLSEEFDVEERQLRGNLPQAFVHAVLIEAALRQSGDG